MDKKMETAINKQINAELYSAYLYLSMATYFEAEGFEGFANWMKIQSQEEMSHAMKFYNYVFERGGRVDLDAIGNPTSQFDSPLDVFKQVLEHEKEVTSLINGLYELAIELKDYATQSMLKWFIDEQVEEEDSAATIVDKVKMAGDKGPGLFMLDKELGGRTFTPPAQEE